VRAATGLAVSVGIGPGKMVAKIASDLGKPDGLVEVRPEEVPGFLHPLPVGRLFGVGPVTQAALAAPGSRRSATSPAPASRPSQSSSGVAAPSI